MWILTMQKFIGQMFDHIEENLFLFVIVSQWIRNINRTEAKARILSLVTIIITAINIWCNGTPALQQRIVQPVS